MLDHVTASGVGTTVSVPDTVYARGRVTSHMQLFHCNATVLGRGASLRIANVSTRHLGFSAWHLNATGAHVDVSDVVFTAAMGIVKSRSLRNTTMRVRDSRFAALRFEGAADGQLLHLRNVKTSARLVAKGASVDAREITASSMLSIDGLGATNKASYVLDGFATTVLRVEGFTLTPALRISAPANAVATLDALRSESVATWAWFANGDVGTFIVTNVTISGGGRVVAANMSQRSSSRFPVNELRLLHFAGPGSALLLRKLSLAQTGRLIFSHSTFEDGATADLIGINGTEPFAHGQFSSRIVVISLNISRGSTLRIANVTTFPTFREGDASGNHRPSTLQLWGGCVSCMGAESTSMGLSGRRCPAPTTGESRRGLGAPLAVTGPSAPSPSARRPSSPTTRCCRSMPTWTRGSAPRTSTEGFGYGARQRCGSSQPVFNLSRVVVRATTTQQHAPGLIVQPVLPAITGAAAAAASNVSVQVRGSWGFVIVHGGVVECRDNCTLYRLVSTASLGFGLSTRRAVVLQNGDMVVAGHPKYHQGVHVRDQSFVGPDAGLLLSNWRAKAGAIPISVHVSQVAFADGASVVIRDSPSRVAVSLSTCNFTNGAFLLVSRVGLESLRIGASRVTGATTKLLVAHTTDALHTWSSVTQSIMAIFGSLIDDGASVVLHNVSVMDAVRCCDVIAYSLTMTTTTINGSGTNLCVGNSTFAPHVSAP